MEISNYSVEFDPFTKRHFIKGFEKRFKFKWTKTKEDIEDICARIDTYLLLRKTDKITSTDRYKLVKLDFAVEGTRQSPTESGNRCILFIDEELRHVVVLLVYCKDDVMMPNEETKWWKGVIKEQYSDIGKLFSL